MKRTSAFLELAERIGNGERPIDALYKNPLLWKLRRILKNTSSEYISLLNRNQLVICLLLAHEIWCDTIDKD